MVACGVWDSEARVRFTAPGFILEALMTKWAGIIWTAWVMAPKGWKHPADVTRDRTATWDAAEQTWAEWQGLA